MSTRKKPDSPKPNHIGRNYGVWVCLFLAIATLAVYGQVTGHDFVNLDDDEYVTGNPQVQTGITLKQIQWAFTTRHANFWHPMTWLSHMLDCHLFGLKAGMHHLSNLLLHIVNSILLFLVLRNMTGALWQSAFVAALFALHPLHVESVAWVSERKDVLSTFFWMLTLWGYGWYVRQPGITHRYGVVLFFFVLGLMAKPMLVTLPFVFLLFDYWPLERIRFGDSGGFLDNSESRSRVLLLIREKIPLFVITAVFCFLAYAAQKSGGAVGSLEKYPFSLRTANALVSYVKYIAKMFWPSRLAVYYPYPDAVPVWQALGAGIVLTGASVLAIRHARKHPWLAVGWLWYLGTLVPVSGLVQVGSHAMADRYTYIPLIGLFIIVAWGLPELFARIRDRNYRLSLSFAVVISILMLLSWRQTGYWKNSVLLYEHALDVTADNAFVHYNMGAALQDENKLSDAIYHYSKSVQINPGFVKAHNNLGSVLAKAGRIREAIRYFSIAFKLNPEFAEAHNNLGLALTESGRITEAMQHFSEALRINPNFGEALYNMGNAFAQTGHPSEAIRHFSKALEIDPDNASVHNNLGLVLADQGESASAIEHYSRALTIKPDFVEAHYNMANVLADQGLTGEAVEHYEKVLDIDPGFAPALNNLSMIYAISGENDKALTLMKRLVDYQPEQAETYYNVACIYARQNKRSQAIDWLQKAIERGYNNWDLIKTDRDLNNIRDSSVYKKLIQNHESVAP